MLRNIVSLNPDNILLRNLLHVLELVIICCVQQPIKTHHGLSSAYTNFAFLECRHLYQFLSADFVYLKEQIGRLPIEACATSSTLQDGVLVIIHLGIIDNFVSM